VIRTRPLLILGLLAALPGSPIAAQEAGDRTTAADELSKQATDPTASLMAFNLTNDFRTSFHGLDDTGYEFRFQPVIPFEAWGASNILRIVVPFQASGPGDNGLKNVSIFDLLVFPQSWGRFGVGPVMSLAESAGTAPSNFTIGPAIGAVVPMSSRLNLGLFNQNLFGDGVALSQLQPIVAYQLGDGWALSAGDLQFIYDWEAGQWVNLPIGAQIGKVLAVLGQPMRLSLNPQWNLRDIEGAIETKIVFTATILAPTGG
jgi:hypothetical protein